MSDEQCTVSRVPTILSEHNERRAAILGIGAALGAYLIWGVSVIFFKYLKTVPAGEVIAHRIIWSALFTGLYLFWRGRFGEIRQALGLRKTALTLAATSILIRLNWGIFVWAVAHARIVEAALGYFMLPLISVAIGFVLLGEKLNRAQMVAVTLALIAVAAQTYGLGLLPWVSVTLSLLFAIYGFARKQVSVGSSPGLFIEVLLLTLPALGYLAFLAAISKSHFLTDGPQISILLILTGPITAIPLILFAEAVRRLRLVTVGLIFYIAPTVQFLVGTLIYGEPVSGFRLATFILIWIALAIIATDAVRAERRRTAAMAPPA